MKLSIISPCYNEELNLPYFFEAIKKLKHSLSGKVDFEVIIVDDKSNDNSRILIKRFTDENDWAIPIFNSRNYGVYRASYKGLHVASGDIIAPMFPVDLQDPPEVLYQLILKKIDAKVTGVFGRKIKREENLLLENTRKVFYYLLDRLSNKQTNKNVGEFGVVDRWVIDECINRNDYYPYLRGMISNITSDLLFIDYTWEKRKAGKSNHNLINLYDQAMNAFISSGTHFFRPLVIFGFIISLASIGFSMLNIFLYLYDKKLFEINGVASLIVITSFFFGFLIVFMGFLGEYIIAIHSQVRGLDRANGDMNNE